MYSLRLSINPEGWLIFSARRRDPAFQTFSQKVLERDQHTCQYCGFRATDYQEIVNKDQNYRNNKLSNLLTACCFCTQCLFLESVDISGLGGGALIYLPELTQNKLNAFCHVLFAAMLNNESYKITAQSTYRTLRLRTQIIESQLGEGMNQPATLGKLLVEAKFQNIMTETDTLLKDIRLLPSRGAFKSRVEHWHKTSPIEFSRSIE